MNSFKVIDNIVISFKMFISNTNVIAIYIIVTIIVIFFEIVTDNNSIIDEYNNKSVNIFINIKSNELILSILNFLKNNKKNNINIVIIRKETSNIFIIWVAYSLFLVNLCWISIFLLKSFKTIIESINATGTIKKQLKLILYTTSTIE